MRHRPSWGGLALSLLALLTDARSLRGGGLRRACALTTMSSARSASDARALVARIRENPHDGKQWMKLASLARRERDSRTAERVLLAGVRAQPSNALLWQALADTLHESSQYSQARAIYRKVLELNATLGSAYHAWGRMEAALGNAETARGLYERGIARGLPRPNPRLTHALAVLLDGTLGRTAEARDLLEDGLALEPHNAPLLHALGVLETNAGNVQAARTYLQRAVAVSSPRTTEEQLRLGRGLAPADAAGKDEAGGAQRAQPYWQAAHALARLEDEAGLRDSARAICQKAVDSTFGAVQLWQFWANLEENDGQSQAARHVYQRATAQHPRDATLWEKWARLEERSADDQSAAMLYEKAIAADPTNADCYSRLARLLLRNDGAAWGGRALALKAARSAYSRGARACGSLSSMGNARRLARLLQEWAVVEWKAEDQIQARVLFERAVTLAPGEHQLAWALQLYARFEVSCGNLAIARHLLARSVNADRFDSSTWRFWGELEEQEGDRVLGQRLMAHATAQDATRTLMSLYRKTSKPPR
jgi:tetratricopeptide (TPR) repeat protein